MVAVNKPMSNIGFKLMRLMFKLRDFFQPRSGVLKEAGIRPGFTVLDFGCGPGGYILPLIDLVGPSGKIHALDIHPLAINEITKIAKRNGHDNIFAIQSDCSTGLRNSSVDAILLYDVFHVLVHTNEVLMELHRVLKSDGTLSFSDHHMKDEEVLKGVTGTGIFKLLRKGRKTHSFAKVD